jgi:hypothetical protein
MISVRPVLLTTEYQPEGLRDFSGELRSRADAKVKRATPPA